MGAAARFLDDADHLLSASAERLEQRIGQLGQGVDLREVTEAIDHSFRSIEQYLEELE